MRVGLDTQLGLGTPTGIGEYVRGLAPALQASGVDVAELNEPRLDPWRFDRRLIWDQLMLPRRAHAARVDLLHCASGTMPLHAREPLVVTVHDVAWLKVQQHARWYARAYFGAFALQRYRKAAAIIVDSQFSRGELLAMGGISESSVHVAYPGVAADFCAIARVPVSAPAILVPGTVERRKNLELLIKLLPELDGARLICVGPSTPYQHECRKLGQALGVSDRIEFRGYVPRAALLQLYATCAAVAVPSRYEGFGYAAAQALCAGAPLLVSDRASLPEVVGEDAAVVPLDDEAEWTRVLRSILSDPRAANARAAMQRERAGARFSWDAGAAATIRAYAAALTER